jgi:hypothetical protein
LLPVLVLDSPLMVLNCRTGMGAPLLLTLRCRDVWRRLTPCRRRSMARGRRRVMRGRGVRSRRRLLMNGTRAPAVSAAAALMPGFGLCAVSNQHGGCEEKGERDAES